MAIDKKIKNEVAMVMQILEINHDEWLSEQYQKFIDENKEDVFKRALDYQNMIQNNKTEINQLDNTIQNNNQESRTEHTTM